MGEWIDYNWKFNITNIPLLPIIGSLRVHKKESIKEILETEFISDMVINKKYTPSSEFY